LAALTGSASANLEELVKAAHAAGVKVTVSLVPMEMVQLTISDLHKIHDLAQRVIKSRQNVGTPMRQAATEVLSLVARANTRKTPNNYSTSPKAV
jgi:uncharacterized membrane protein YjjP (DUF1212 family)